MGSYMCAVVISATLVYRVVTETHDKAFLCGKKSIVLNGSCREIGV